LREAVVDTNVLVYDTFEDSLYHETAARLLDNLDRWLVPLIVILSTCGSSKD
jgi:predicted nucleic acid-binding protein